jgi:hypothetical protein
MSSFYVLLACHLIPEKHKTLTIDIQRLWYRPHPQSGISETEDQRLKVHYSNQLKVHTSQGFKTREAYRNGSLSTFHPKWLLGI